jgi:hypothetical protein
MMIKRWYSDDYKDDDRKVMIERWWLTDGIVMIKR